jgi:hypothetical protein
VILFNLSGSRSQPDFCNQNKKAKIKMANTASFCISMPTNTEDKTVIQGEIDSLLRRLQYMTMLPETYIGLLRTHSVSLDDIKWLSTNSAMHKDPAIVLYHGYWLNEKTGLFNTSESVVMLGILLGIPEYILRDYKPNPVIKSALARYQETGLRKLTDEAWKSISNANNEILLDYVLKYHKEDLTRVNSPLLARLGLIDNLGKFR